MSVDLSGIGLLLVDQHQLLLKSDPTHEAPNSLDPDQIPLTCVSVMCTDYRSAFSPTVYTQHLTYFRDKKTDREPLLEDFHQELTRWANAREILVVFMDANGDIGNGPVNDMFQSV